MLRNYFKISFRNLWKHRLFSLINLTGLAVGLAVSLFIAYYVWHEFHYDQFHPYSNRTYRIGQSSKFAGNEMFMTGMPASFGNRLKQQVPEVENVVRLATFRDKVLKSDYEHRFKEKDILFADASFLDVFGFRLVAGNRQTALANPGSILLTESLARKYFGGQNPVGKTIIYDLRHPMTVTGVVADPPSHTAFRFRALVSFLTIPTLGDQPKYMYEEGGFADTYLVLKPGASVNAVVKKLKAVSATLPFRIGDARYFLDAVPQMHLYSQMDKTGSARQYLYVFMSIALIILVLAVANYVSLTTARATQRAKEVGVRKVVGGRRRELITQFYLESVLTTVLAFGLALLLFRTTLPLLSSGLELGLDETLLADWRFWAVMLGVWVLCTGLAGSYPAVLLSRFSPQEVLKSSSRLDSARSGAFVRRFFTVFQFSASIALLICSLVLYRQMHYLQNKNLGIQKDQVAAIAVDASMGGQLGAFRDEVRQQVGAGNVALGTSPLFTMNIATYFIDIKDTKKQIPLQVLTVDKDFLPTLNIRWKHAPLNDEDALANQAHRTLLNETAVRMIGLDRNPVGEKLPFNFGPDEQVDGVVKDFAMGSLRSTVSPLMITVKSDTSQDFKKGCYLYVRFQPQTPMAEKMASIGAIYNRYQRDIPFDYYFLDDAYNQLYKTEIRMARLIGLFTGLTMLVACLGLLGLIVFMVEARTKEIGIRKVLGASVVSIVALLSTDFLKLVLLAVLIASPIAWYFMHQWLQDFAYKIDLDWSIFGLAALSTLVIAFLTVSFQSVKAALANPVKSLKRE